MADTPRKRDDQVQAYQPQDVVNAELNFLKFPLFVLHQKSREVREADQIEYRSTKVTEDRTEEIVWKVLPSREYGLPGQFDRQVFRVVEKILSEMDIPIRNPIPLPSLSEICRMLGITDNGTNCTLVKEALMRIRSTSIIAKNTVQVREGKKRRYLEAGFGVYDMVVFIGDDLPEGRGRADRNYLFLNQWYLNNINNFYVRLIDYEYWTSIKEPTSQRLYEILGPLFFGQNGGRVGIAYRELCALGPLTVYPHLSRIRQQLEKAVTKLTATGFLADVEYARDRDGEVMLYFYPGPRVRVEAERLKEAWVRKRTLGPKTTSFLPRLKALAEQNQTQMALEFQAVPEPDFTGAVVPELEEDEPGFSLIAPEQPPAPAAPPEPRPRGDRSATVYLQAFYHVFFGTEKRGRVTPKERQAAADFLDVLGPATLEQAEDCMRAIREQHRPWTEQVKHIGGLVHLISSYAPVMDAKRHESDDARRREEREAMLGNLRGRYEAWLQESLEQRLVNLSPREQGEYDNYRNTLLGMSTRKFRRKFELDDPHQALVKAVTTGELTDQEAQTVLDEADENAREMVLPKIHESLPTFEAWLELQGFREKSGPPER